MVLVQFIRSVVKFQILTVDSVLESSDTVYDPPPDPPVSLHSQLVSQYRHTIGLVWTLGLITGAAVTLAIMQQTSTRLVSLLNASIVTL